MQLSRQKRTKVKRLLPRHWSEERKLRYHNDSHCSYQRLLSIKHMDVSKEEREEMRVQAVNDIENAAAYAKRWRLAFKHKVH